MSKRFVYALEPVRLQRSWLLDALRLQLAVLNGRLAEQEKCIQGIRTRIEANHQAWRTAANGALPLQAHLLAAYSAYQGQLERELARACDRLAALRTEQEAQLVLVLEATRRLDALEEHKVEDRKVFSSEQEKARLVEADDHWSILQNGSSHARQI